MPWLREPDDLTDGVQRWLPRLLGMAPLLILAVGLLVQGGPRAGLSAVIFLLALCVGLLVLYSFISYSQTEKYNPSPMHKPEESRATGSSSRFAPAHAAITRALRSDHTTTPVLPVNLFLATLNWLYEGLTASPYPFEAFKLRYSYNSNGSDSQSFDITTDLIQQNDAILDKEAFSEKYALIINEINGVSIPEEPSDTWELTVNGGRIQHPPHHERRANGNPLLFTPDHKFPGVTTFSYKVTRQLRHPTRNQPQRFEFDTSNVIIKPNFSSEQSPEAEAKPRLERLFQRSIQALQSFKQAATFLLKIRVQIGIVLTTLLLFQTSQVKDVLLAIVLEPSVISKHLLMAALIGAILSFLLWLTSRQLIRVYPLIERRRDGKSNLSLKREGIFSHEIELLLFWAGWISLALFSTPITKEAFAFPGQPWELYLVKPYVLFFAGSLLIWCWRLWDRPVSTLTPGFKRTFFILLALGFAAPFLFGLISSAQLIPNILGSIAILFWGMTLFLIIATTIFQFSIFSGFPLLSLLLVLCFFNAATRINDNHMIRLNPQLALATSDPEPITSVVANPAILNRHLPSLEQALAGWLLQRKDQISQYSRENPYPVYVVTAQGGGIYAAYHSAKALAVLSDELPSFSDHLFAISGVSGGSFGATIYANALRSQPTEQTPQLTLGERIDQYFDNRTDRLAMILAAMLFGDATQTIFPTPVAAWDRSLGLELAFENHRAPEAEHPIRLDASFYLSQDPELNPDYTLPSPSRTTPGHAAPYLVLNTTEVNNGRRHILSPFRIPEEITLTKAGSKTRGHGQASINLSDADFHEPWLQRPSQMKPLDIRFSTAAGLSARFPVISPHGFFPESRYRRFIDGGLYDNSGAVTAKEVLDGITIALSQFNPDHPLSGVSESDFADLKKMAKLIKFHPIAIVDQQAVSLDSSYADAEVLAQKRPIRWLSWAPMDAIFSTREARLQKAVDLLDQDPQILAPGLEGPALAQGPRRVLLRKQFRLAGHPQPVFSIPLGWKLSCQARAFINDQLQPLPPTTESLTDPANPPWDTDGQVYSLLPCEQRALRDAIKREPVRPRGASEAPSGASSLSRPFWSLIEQLQVDLALPADRTTAANPSLRRGTASSQG
jgi:hypothetical protein